MRRYPGAVLIFLITVMAASPVSAAVTVHQIRQWQAPDHTRLVFDLSGPVEHRTQLLSNPARLQVDIDQAAPAAGLALDSDGARHAGVTITRDGNSLRAVLALKADVQPKSFLLKPAGPYGHRLVIDLFDARVAEEASRPAPPPAAREAKRAYVIAIDAGHGGEDPGAIGRRYRTREKDVTLAIARELFQLVSREPGMKPVLIRAGDYYVGLRDRFAKARRMQADVFVSIHADAIPGVHARGSSVYVLSDRAASGAIARHLAERENAADLIGGVSLNDKDPTLAKVLLDLSHTATIQDSVGLAGNILTELRRVGPVHMVRVQHANFMVLKSPDVPSVLVETAFISNPTEEKNLRTPSFQRDIANGLFRGIKRYLANNRHQAPPPALIAEPGRPPAPAAPGPPPAAGVREHVVRRGETLVSIARLYNVHVEALRFFNDLRGSELPAGLRLRIPPNQGDS